MGSIGWIDEKEYSFDCMLRMGQQELSGSVLFLFGQRADGDQRRVQRASEADRIADFDGVISFQVPEIQLVHTEGGGESAHGAHGGAETVHHACGRRAT